MNVSEHRESLGGASAPVDTGFLPNFCSIPVVFAVVLSAQLLALVLVLGAGTAFSVFWERLSLVSLFVQWIALSSAAVLCLARPWLRRLPNGVAGGLAWLLVMAATASVSELAFVLALDRLDLLSLDRDARTDLLVRSLGVSAIVTALLLRYFHLHHLWKRQVVAVSEARFQALQSRIRPHFLFNSMNTIASLVPTDPHKAEELVQDLADLFRAALGRVDRESSLAQELLLSRRYLNIEQQRLGDRLRVDWDLEALPGQAVLPPMVLQPLVENAVYHGIEPASSPGVIHIAGRYRRDRVNLSVRNSLPHAAGGPRHRAGNRLAVDNIRQRLTAMFGSAATLSETKVDEEYQIRLVFPHPREEL